MKYRKKPVIVEAMQFFNDYCGKDTVAKCVSFCEGKAELKEDFLAGEVCLSIKTAEGVMSTRNGFWIIKAPDPKGGSRFWPVDAEYFAANYEKVEETKT